MRTEESILGLWWLPTNPDEKWPGTLVLKPDTSPTLNVTTEKSVFQFGDKLEAPTVIHGHNDMGKFITLLFPSWPQTKGGMRLSQVQYEAGYAIVGDCLADDTEFLAHSITFQMQYLLEWSGLSGFGKEDMPQLHDINIKYRRPEDQLFTVDSDLSVSIRVGYSLQNNSNEKILNEDLYFEYISKKGARLSDYKKYQNALRQLLHFATLKRVYPLRVTTRKNGHGITHGDEFWPLDIEVWTSILREPVKHDLHGDRWIFRFADVKTDFGTFIGNWIEYLEKFDEAIDCYFGTIYHRFPDSIEHLSLTQALDAYHGIKFNSHKEQDFKKKLTELIQPHTAHLKGLIDDVDDFVATVHHNRNYYTHHNPKWKENGRVVSGSKLFQLNEKLRLVFQMRVLSDIQIPQDRFIRLRRQLADAHMDIP